MEVGQNSPCGAHMFTIGLLFINIKYVTVYEQSVETFALKPAEHENVMAHPAVDSWTIPLPDVQF